VFFGVFVQMEQRQTPSHLNDSVHFVKKITKRLACPQTPDYVGLERSTTAGFYANKHRIWL